MTDITSATMTKTLFYMVDSFLLSTVNQLRNLSYSMRIVVEQATLTLEVRDVN